MWKAKIRYFHAIFELFSHQGPNKQTDLFSEISLYFVLRCLATSAKFTTYACLLGHRYWKMPVLGCPKCMFTLSEVCRNNKLQFFKLFQELTYKIKQPVLVLLVSFILDQGFDTHISIRKQFYQLSWPFPPIPLTYYL